MDWKEIVVGLLGIGLPALGWMLRTVWEDLREHQQDLQDYKLHVADNYVKRSEVDDLRSTIEKQFERIHERLDDYFGVRKP